MFFSPISPTLHDSYLGAGDMNIVGEQFARLALTLDQNGAGMTWFNGAGSGTLIYTPSLVIALVRAQKILGAEVRVALHDATYVCQSLVFDDQCVCRSLSFDNDFCLCLSPCTLFCLSFSSRLCLCLPCECLHAPMAF